VPSHFIERHGAVIIVALGETIIALPAFNGVFRLAGHVWHPSVFRPLTP
jgi:low temperature requirement protein LtrA